MEVLAEGSQSVVAPLIDGTEQTLHHTAVSGIGSQQYGQRVHAGNHQHHEDAQHNVSQDVVRLRIRVATFLEPIVDMRHAILKNT